MFLGVRSGSVSQLINHNIGHEHNDDETSSSIDKQVVSFIEEQG